MHFPPMANRPKSANPPGITVRFPPSVRDRVSKVAEFEHRSAAAYIQHLVEQDLRRRDEDERIVRVYVSADAPEWSGTVIRGESETAAQHAERTAILNQLLGTN